jgi:hypothetical protein
MILRAADGTVYKVHFRHLFPVVKRRVRPHTECLLHLADCRLGLVACVVDIAGKSREFGQVIATMGVARCSPRDTFNKAMGRRIALGRALKHLVSDEGVRGQLMIDYLRQISR